MKIESRILYPGENTIEVPLGTQFLLGLSMTHSVKRRREGGTNFSVDRYFKEEVPVISYLRAPEGEGLTRKFKIFVLLEGDDPNEDLKHLGTAKGEDGFYYAFINTGAPMA